jgi:hypothetical protein
MIRLSAQGPFTNPQAFTNPQQEETARNIDQRFSSARAAVGAVLSTAEVLVEKTSCNRLDNIYSREVEEDGMGTNWDQRIREVLAQVLEMAVANLPATVSSGPF